MKTIAVIDLLNKIAKGEKVPKVIKYNDYNFRHIDNYCYVNKEGELLSTYIYAEESRLNDEVEIIEDTPKEDKKIKRIDANDMFWHYSYVKKDEMQQLKDNVDYLRFKVNEIIDKVYGE